MAAECVGAGARLEGAASQHVSARGLDRPRCLHHDLFRVHGAGPGYSYQAAVADLQRPHLDDGVLLLDLAAGQLERLANADDGVDPVQDAKLVEQLRVDGAQHGDNAALHAPDHVVLEA